jgi:hypothetical protein
LKLKKIWRQNAQDKGAMVDYQIDGIEPDMSFLGRTEEAASMTVGCLRNAFVRGKHVG